MPSRNTIPLAFAPPLLSQHTVGVRARPMAMLAKVEGELPQMYRDRWAGAAGDAEEGKGVVMSRGTADEEAEEGEVCITADDGREVCGEPSFDSTSEMVCIEDPNSPDGVPWICK